MSRRIPERKQDEASDRPTTFLDPSWSFSQPSTWPLSICFLPIGILAVALWAALFFPNTFGDITSPLVTDTSCRAAFNYTFQIARAKHHAETLATEDWEIGTVAEALLELISPEKSVFGKDPFPGGQVPSGSWKIEPALEFFLEKVPLPEGSTLMENDFSATDPAALGISAVIIGQNRPEWRQAAHRQKDYLLQTARRYENGAISHRLDIPELRSEAIFMFPPFLAYYGVATGDLEVVREAVRQIRLYRDVLLTTEGQREGLWSHFIGSDKIDSGAYSIATGWVVYGMARVRATVSAWNVSREIMGEEIRMLDGWMVGIIDAVIRHDNHPSGLLRNYLGEGDWFEEPAGTAFVTAAAYRLGMFPEKSTAERERILRWADEKRRIMARHVDEDGVARKIENSLRDDEKDPPDGVSSQTESFLLMLGAAWRDCYCAGVCPSDP